MKYLYYYLAQLDSPDELGIPDQQLDRASLDALLNGVYAIAGFIAVLMIIIAGLSYITSSGDSAKLTKAKNTIVYSVIGLIIVVAAFAITNFVIKKAA